MIEIHCADEATGLEDTVEPWKELIVKTLVELHKSKATSPEVLSATEEGAEPDSAAVRAES